jgi:hypothetical protein
MGAQADIECRLVGDRAGTIETAEVLIGHLSSDLRGKAL